MDLRFLLSTDDYPPLLIESRLSNNLVNNSRFIWTKFTDEAAVEYFKQAILLNDDC